MLAVRHARELASLRSKFGSEREKGERGETSGSGHAADVKLLSPSCCLVPLDLVIDTLLIFLLCSDGGSFEAVGRVRGEKIACVTKMGNDSQVFCPDVALVSVRANTSNPHLAVNIVLPDFMKADVNGPTRLGHVRLRRQMFRGLRIRIQVVFLPLLVAVEL